MFNTAENTTTEISTIESWLTIEAPPLYSTDDIDLNDKVVVVHCYAPFGDWFIVEYDPDSQIAFGYAVYAGNEEFGEWGYIPLKELLELSVSIPVKTSGDAFTPSSTFSCEVGVELDCLWKPCPASEVSAIRVL